MSKLMLGLLALAPAVKGDAMSGGRYHVSSDPNARTCHTPVLTAEEERISEELTQQKLSERKKKNAVYVESTVIDVHYHIITCSDGSGSLTDAHLDDQMTVMNDAFAGTGFSFVEVSRDIIVNDDWCTGLDSDSTEVAMKQALRKGDGAALNFYTSQLAGGLLGWAYYPTTYASSPWLDGVVNLHSSLPGAGTGSYSLGMTAVHEVGHWLGLRHTFNGDGCGNAGDLVADTPEVNTANYGCPTGVDSCPLDNQGPDMTENFMDYTDDACMDTFTAGQAARMVEQFNAYRLDAPCIINCGPSPTATPTVSIAPTQMCVDVVIEMTDTYGDGWNGNYLHFERLSNVDATVTLGTDLSSGSATVCLVPGTYSAYCCTELTQETWPEEVGWSIPKYDVYGGIAQNPCGSATKTFVVSAGDSATPTLSPTMSPTMSPTSSPTASPTVTPNVHVVLEDSYGDGWNGNHLYFGDHTQSTTIKVTLPNGVNGHGPLTIGLALPPGEYSPYACGGSYDYEITWTITETGLTGGATNNCASAVSSGSFTVGPDGWVATPTPTISPTSSPTTAPTECGEYVTVDMADTYGDGWNGNYLYFDDVANMFTTELKMTFTSGHSKTKTICLPPGVYSPFACGGGWPGEVSWVIQGYGISGGAANPCVANSGSFTILEPGQTHNPTGAPTPAPTPYPTGAPTASPSVAPTPSPTPSGGGGDGECCCEEKINEVLANQATMLNELSSDTVLSSDSEAGSSSSSSSPSSGKINVDSTTLIVSTVLCATVFAGAIVMAVFYRKKVQELEQALGHHAPLGSLEMGGLGLGGGAY